MQRRRTGEADRQAPTFTACGTAYHLCNPFSVRKDLPGFIQQREPGGGGAYTTGQALHQHHAQLGLKVLQHPRQRGLLHAQAFRRAGDVAFFSDGNEGLELAKLQHRNTFQVWEGFNPGICSHGSQDLRCGQPQKEGKP